MRFQKECDNKPIDGKSAQDITHGQSDCPIVSMKSCNQDGEKGAAGTQECARETPAGVSAGLPVETKLAHLTEHARESPQYKCTSVMGMLVNVDFLTRCFHELKRNKAVGIDNVTIEEYEKNLRTNLEGLRARIRSWQYRPQAVRRVYIPKSDGSKRGLGIPAVEDKIVQMGIKKILEAMFEGDFCDVSYGFRPNRSCHQALSMLDKAITSKPINCVVDMDINKYFDSINHEKLLECLRQRIADTSLLRLISRVLRAGVMEEGKYTETDKGTPQGGIISPVLSNIYLHYVLDLWFEKEIKPQFKGHAQLIRYADDFVVLFQSKHEAQVFSGKLTERLDKYGLKVAQGKSRIIEFGRYVWQSAQAAAKDIATFNFLSFTHFCDKTRKGGFKVGRKTSRVKFIQKAKAMNKWLKGIRNLVKLTEWWKTLKQKLIGHYNYYGVSGNYKALAAFYRLTLKLCFKWINRRSQKKSFNSERFSRYLSVNPLPEPRIYHSLYMTAC
jgi:group II intron reverse transcriptase/maturase